MKFSYSIIYVSDVAQTLEFYEKAFGFTKRFMTPECDYGELATGETTIAFASIELGNSNFKQGFMPLNNHSNHKKPLGIEFAFTSENLETDFQTALDAGAIEYQAITEKPWGQKVGYVLDNNGFLIELCTPIEKQ